MKRIYRVTRTDKTGEDWTGVVAAEDEDSAIAYFKETDDDHPEHRLPMQGYKAEERNRPHAQRPQPPR